MKFNRRTLLALLIVVAGCAQAGAPRFAPEPGNRPPGPSASAEALLAASGLSGKVGFVVMDVASGEIFELLNADLPLPPASAAKAPTALFALDRLGPDHVFETRLMAAGAIVGGVLDGDLILQGGGDPETDSAVLASLASQASAAGLARVNGRFLTDAALLPEIPVIDATQPDVASYNPSVGALNLNFNRVLAKWSRKGKTLDLRAEAHAAGISPETGAVIIEANAPAGGFARRPDDAQGRERWSVSTGALGRSGSRWLPVRHPSAYAGDVFRRLAAERGVQAPAPAPGAGPIMSWPLARAQSRPLQLILRDMLKHSTNLTAEATGMAASAASGARITSLASSAAALNDWAARFAGFPVGDPGFQLVNHSGLEAASRVSALRMTQLLFAAEKRGFPALSGGRPATLKSLLPDKPYLERGAPEPVFKVRLLAKTGTMDYVSALAGYIWPEAGRPLVFAIFTADEAARSRIFGRAEDRAPGARSWSARSRKLQRALVRSWISRFAAP